MRQPRQNQQALAPPDFIASCAAKPFAPPNHSRFRFFSSLGKPTAANKIPQQTSRARRFAGGEDAAAAAARGKRRRRRLERSGAAAGEEEEAPEDKEEDACEKSKVHEE
jgi:hypothetical protein